jgi:signal peptidase I
MIAVVLTLIQPGAGHFLLGHFRRGAMWAVALTIGGILLLLVIPLSLVALAIGAALGLVARIVCAADTTRVQPRQPRWVWVALGWLGLVVGSVLLDVRDYYRTHYVQAFTIPSRAMTETLLHGDYIIVDKAVYRSRPPRRGDIVVFRYPVDERRDFVFRIVGMPGETLQLRGGRLVIDGRELAEPYIQPTVGSSGLCAYAFGCEPLLVPGGAYFVMGDNRDNANDSRFWGFVKREKIKGRAAEIYWSWDSDRHWLRWRRIGQRIS